jgi:hypothetical protein
LNGKCFNFKYHARLSPRTNLRIISGPTSHLSIIPP